MDADLVWTTLAGVVLVVGLCGVVIPVLPGLLLMWGAAIAYGFAVGWSTTGVAAMVVLTAAVAVSAAASVVVPRRAAAGGGASGWAQLGGLVGAVVGFFVIPVVGVVVGALLGVFAVELGRQGDRHAAWEATVATARGFGVAVLIDLAIGLVMLAVWAGWAATVVL
jgi:uncharacterized protein YqgC (DUF456 family)